MHRRRFLATGGAMIAAPALIGRAFAAEAGRPLPMPEVLDLDAGAPQELAAIRGSHEFLSGTDTPVLGFGGGYMGPLLRVKRGQTARPAVRNGLGFPVSSHWHGLHVPGSVDGGPQLFIPPGETWKPELEIDQPAGTYWYHSHIHMQTGPQVYYGLAGMMIIEDPDAPDGGLPSTLGEDDLPLAVQDRAFDAGGALSYSSNGPAGMMGFRAAEIVVNGAIRPRANVPAGLVRLRLLNASNARIYDFAFEDRRAFHQVASDAGLLRAPAQRENLRLGPGERAEIVVDFSDAKPVRLLSAPDENSPMGGMMSFFMGGSGNQPEAVNRRDEFEVMSFAVDQGKTAKVLKLPQTLAGAPKLWAGEPVRTRRFDLNVHGGGMMGGGGMSMTISGQSMDLNVINHEVRTGDIELWEVTSASMAHPFHVHGTSFQIVSLDGRKVDPAAAGFKDVILVETSAQVLVRFDQKADKRTPYMYHCHILEHEDAGMMGQFTVS